jgi:hypothetical protein
LNLFIFYSFARKPFFPLTLKCHLSFLIVLILSIKTTAISNQEVTLQEHGNVKARITGLDSSGLLRAITDDGEIYLLQPDGNSFDMLKGLISKKA